jgi:cell wall-associated NlpC family hydrolase
MLRSNLPVKRVVSPSTAAPNQFASLLKTASIARPTTTLQTTRMNVPQRAAIYHSARLDAAAPAQLVAGGPTPMSRSDIVKNAEQLLNIPYVWGGNANSGLDCSAFVSRAWGISRHTTDNLAAVSRAISKEELEQGDALNLTTSNDRDGTGHVRLFDRWADAAHTRMYVYEETPPRSIHHVINWDPKYQPMRRTNVTDA